MEWLDEQSDRSNLGAYIPCGFGNSGQRKQHSISKHNYSYATFHS